MSDGFEEIVDPQEFQSHHEKRLLLISGLFIFTNLGALWIQNSQRGMTHFIIGASWLFCVIVGYRGLNYFIPNRDKFLFPIVMFLSGWGLAIIDRLAPRFAERQAVWLILSVFIMLAITALPQAIVWLRNYRYLWLIFGLSLLISTIILGKNPSGQAGAPQLWLGFGDIFFQPSEALKIILVAFLASYLAEQYPALRAEGLVKGNRLLATPARVFGPVLLMWGLSIVMLIWQRDLGTAILFFIVFLTLLYISSGYVLVLVGGIFLILVAGIVGYNLFSVVGLRIDIWLNPWPEADGRAYQIVQSLQAFAAGGIFGQGIGQGSPTYIPVVHSDFIFAALAEEWGLFGVITLLVCITTFVFRGTRISSTQQGKPFQALLGVGLTSLIAVQSIMIMGGVIRLLPLTGVTLPFLSYGGSSLLTSFIMVGLLLRLSATVQPLEEYG